MPGYMQAVAGRYSSYMSTYWGTGEQGGRGEGLDMLSNTGQQLKGGGEQGEQGGVPA